MDRKELLEEALEIREGYKSTYEFEILINRIKENKDEFKEMLGDREFVLQLLRNNGKFFYILPIELRNDEEVFWVAYENAEDVSAIEIYESAGEELKNNRQFKYKLMEESGHRIFGS